ncbi:hypothetical protein PhCBS80983_g00459 [Powellomyces hirtus]|uniref:Protein Mpv17 n=1 Tax=Powellomyces hirtus TaxID=109895 RepID=A0A507EFR4_9FUNG|nr:hypothetical protein PhCBS80983_g00459 [Powellomyces hirtus]
MTSLARWYHATLTQNPTVTQAVSTGFLFAAGDCIAQHAVEKKTLEEHDWARTGRLTAYGTFGLGPAIAVWYRWLNTTVKIKNPFAATITRMVIDQSVFAPLNMVCFFTAMGVMEGKSGDEIKKKMRETFVPTLKANYALWPPIQLVNFYLTPVNYQSLVVNVTALGWNSYLSFANAKTA